MAYRHTGIQALSMSVDNDGFLRLNGFEINNNAISLYGACVLYVFRFQSSNYALD